MSFLCDASHRDSVDGHLRASPSSSHVSTRARVHISLRWGEGVGEEGRGGEVRSDLKARGRQLAALAHLGNR